MPTIRDEQAAFMILPAKDPQAMRLLRIPDDYEQHEAFRHVTGLIAQVEEDDPGCDWDDIESALDEHGFESVAYVLGPGIDQD